MKAVIYARVSTKEQATNLSLPTQIQACRDFCDREGMKVAEVFSEEGESAKTTNRSAFQRMLARCRKSKGSVQYVVVYALNRFARDKFDHYAIRAHLHKLGISLRSVTEPIDDSSSGKLMEGILASFAQFDNDVRAERTTAGMIEALSRGRWTFKAPLGYLKGEGGRSEPSLMLDPERAPIIAEAFRAVARGDVASEALAWATEAGLRTTRGKNVSPQTWIRLLANPIYSGRVVVSKWGVDAIGDFDAIVSRPVFLAAQAVLKGRAHSPEVHRRRRDSFPLRHFVRCEACATPLTAAWSRGKSGKRYGYYWCRHGCQGQRYSKKVLESMWLARLERLKPTE